MVQINRDCDGLDEYLRCPQLPASSSDSAAGKQASGTELVSSPNDAACAASPTSLLGMGQQQAAQPSADDIAADLPICQVLGCTEVLVKTYCLKKRTCTAHMQALAVHLTADDTLYRFCQQCGKFEHISKFDDSKRSCRARLAKRRCGTRAQLMKKGCSSHFSGSPAPSRSTSNAHAEAVAVAAVPDLPAASAAVASDELPDFCSDWREQFIERSSRSACLPVSTGPVSGLQRQQQLLQPVTKRSVDSFGLLHGGAGSCSKQGAATACTALQQGTFSTPVQSFSDGATVQAQAATTAAAAAQMASAHALSAPVLCLPGSYNSGFGTAAQADDLMLDAASVVQLLELDDPHQETLDNTMTEADLIAALQREMEADSAAWQHQQSTQRSMLEQRFFGSSHIRGTALGMAAVDATLRAAARGAPSAPTPPALLTVSSLNSQGQLKPAAAGTASEGPSGSDREASGCSIPLAKLRLNSAPTAGVFMAASAPLPRLPSDVSTAAVGGMCNGSELLRQSHQEQPPAGPLLTQQSSGKSSRLQWLVQQMQMELRNCDAEDLSTLNVAEMETLLHTVLATMSGSEGSENSAGVAAAASAGGGSTGATPAPSVSATHQTLGVNVQQSIGHSQHVAPSPIAAHTSTPTFPDDFLVHLDSTGSSKGPAAFESPFSKTASLPILNGSVISIGDTFAGPYSRMPHTQQTFESWPGQQVQQAQQQYLMLQQQQQQQLQLHMVQLEHSQQSVVTQRASVGSACCMPGMANQQQQQQPQVQEQLTRQQLALIQQHAKDVQKA